MKNILYHLNESNKINVKENTRFVLDFPDFSKDKSYEVKIFLEKPGVEVEIIAVYKLHASQQVNLLIETVHKVPNTTCNTSVKGVLLEGSSSNFIGKIIIEKNAQHTSAFLEDAILVSGDNTKNESQPILQIDADDVKASHGATTGKVSKEHVYYLQARGFSKEEAELIIIKGFFESLVSRIDDDIVRDKVWKKLDA